MRLPECGFFRKIQGFGKARKTFAFQRKKRIEVGGVELGCGVETRGVVHAAFTAPAERIALNVPFDETESVGVAVTHDPFNVAFEFRKGAAEKSFIIFHFQNFRDAESKNRRLSEV